MRLTPIMVPAATSTPPKQYCGERLGDSALAIAYKQKVSGLQVQPQYRQCSRSIHCLTCPDLLLSLSPLGSHQVQWKSPTFKTATYSSIAHPTDPGSAIVTVVVSLHDTSNKGMTEMYPFNYVQGVNCTTLNNKTARTCAWAAVQSNRKWFNATVTASGFNLILAATATLDTAAGETVGSAVPTDCAYGWGAIPMSKYFSCTPLSCTPSHAHHSRAHPLMHTTLMHTLSCTPSHAHPLMHTTLTHTLSCTPLSRTPLSRTPYQALVFFSMMRLLLFVVFGAGDLVSPNLLLCAICSHSPFSPPPPRAVNAYDAGTGLPVLPWNTTSYTGVCTSNQYCCPDSKRCLTVVGQISCWSGATACATHPGSVCCPLTKMCVMPGVACTPPCDDNSYCCPDAKHRSSKIVKHCLTPVSPGTFCTGPGTQGSCAAFQVCCPLTSECVSTGAACVPP
jgi:hypothetical protein